MEVTPSDSAALPVASAAPTLATAWGRDGPPHPVTGHLGNPAPASTPIFSFIKFLLPGSELYYVQDRIKQDEAQHSGTGNSQQVTLASAL